MVEYPIEFRTRQKSRITEYFENGTNEKIISTENIQGFNDTNGLCLTNSNRVNYECENWHNIIKALNNEHYNQIHALNRAQLVDDALILAFDDYIDFDVALGVFTYLRHQTDYIP